MSNLSEINVVILAGGRGTRLKSILPEQQKVVAKVKEHPFLEYILKQLNKAGFKNVVICTSYLSDQVKKTLGNYYLDLSLFYSNEQPALGTAGAIAKILPRLSSDDILIMNGDSFCLCDLQSAYEFYLKKGTNGTIIIKEEDNTDRYGKVGLNENGELVSFKEKEENRGKGLINAGIYIIKKSLLAEIPKEMFVSLEKEMFPSWIGKGFYGFKTTGKFIDIGTEESYKEAEEFFSQNPI